MTAAFAPNDRTGPGLPPAIAAGFRAAIEAACAHLGATAPNPPVGCAILDAEGQLLVAAGHPRAGQPHAEALALSRLAEAGRIGEAHTLVVTLEPCNHTGRTGPCTEAILASPVVAVWIGCPDPNPDVRGHGAERLAAAGRQVHRLHEACPLQDDCASLIAPFRRRVRDGRPWITVKQALDRQGSMIPPAGASTFTSAVALTLAHRLRRATDAIVTGTGTVLADRPGFTVRHVPDHAARIRPLLVLGRRDLPPGYPDSAALALSRLADLDRLPAVLAEAGVLWAMVEAGPALLDAIDRAGLWDDWLRIRQGADGSESVSVLRPRGRTDVSPLRLLDGLDPATS